MSLFQLAKHHGTTSCYQKYLLLSGLPLVIENTSCYRDYLFSSETPLVIGSTSCYRDYLFSSETPFVIGSTSCYRDHLFLSEGPLVIESTSCYRDHLFLSEGPLVIVSTSCYRDYLLLSKVPLVIGSTSRYRKAFLSDRERHSSLSLSGGQERTGMVEGLLKNEQWQKHFAPGRTRHNILRCFQARMGGTFESSKNKGSMELGGKVKVTHKLARVKSSFPGFASFSSPTKTSTCSDWHRQQNSNDLYQQIRGNPFTSSHISSLRDVELCSRQKPDFVSSVCSRRGKPDCRQKSRVFQDSLEWMLHPVVFQALQKEVGCFSIDLFATQVNHQVPAFFSWRPESGAVATDAFDVKWDFQLAYLFPPFCMIKRCLRKIQQDQAHCVLITPVWKSSPWYPVILSLLVGQPLFLPRRLDLLRLPGTKKIHPLCLQKNFRPFQGKTRKGRIFSETFRYPPLLLEEENCQSV